MDIEREAMKKFIETVKTAKEPQNN